MATLFQLLILAQVYLYSRGETPCSLLQTCSLEFNEPLSTCACLAKLGGARGQINCTFPWLEMANFTGKGCKRERTGKGCKREKG